MEKRAVLAIVLSLAVWLGWIYFMKPKPDITKVKEAEKIAEVEKTKELGKKEVQPVEVVKKSSSVIKKMRTTVLKAGEEKEIVVKTDKYTVTLSNLGAVIKKLKYNERNIDLVIPGRKFKAKGFFDFPIHFSEDEFLNGGILETSIWSSRVAGENSVSFSTTVVIDNLPVRFEKIYSFIKGSYHFRVENKITNLGRKELSIKSGYIISSAGDFLGPEVDFDNTYNQLSSIYFINGDFEKGSKGGGFFSKNGIVNRENGAAQWVGVMSRYFLIIMIPENFTGTGVISDNRETTAFRTGLYIPLNTIKPREEIARSFKVYLGEKDKDKLAKVDKSIVDAADVSRWIEPIKDFLLWCLMKLNILFGNFGWSLVVFSIISKIAFLPLTQKSTESMKRMQALSPKISEIKDKFKENSQKMNQEIMKLYKKEKVNPASGCLPLLLQMPFFFALYSALINSVDLWRAPFMLWINDLSMPDTVYQISGFNINILPILMTATTFVQQKMTTGDAGGQQQKMMMFMPLIFIVIFWNMPSGLVLYWTLQNVLQVAHQIYTNKKASKEGAK